MKSQPQAIGRSMVTTREKDGWRAYFASEPEKPVFHRNRSTAIKMLQERDQKPKRTRAK